MGARLGILESGNKNDMLHTLVYQLTQKESIKSLTEDEYKLVVKDLAERLKLQNMDIPPCHPYKAKKYEDSGRGMMSDGQRRKVWQLMYQLEKLDIEHSSAKLGDRLCGIIKKELHIDTIPKAPFKWIKYSQGVKLIEILKKYVANAQRRKDGVKSDY
jgi:hypothetical protein